MKSIVLSALLLVSGAAFGETVGPNGERPTPSKSLQISEAQVAEIKKQKLTAAFVWHESSDYTTAVDQGARDELARLGVGVVAVTDAGFDIARQRADIETVLSKSPSIMISLPVDAVASASAYKAAADAGVTLVFVDNAPKGFVHGQDYVTVVSDDLFQMGSAAGHAMASALDKKGKVGYIFHDADFYVTNQRDNAFKSTIEGQYPNIQIAAQAGIADPALGEEVAQAMLTQHPDLDGIYVTWAEPALGVLSKLRADGNKHTQIVTLDLSEPVALDMVKGGNVAAIVADEAYDIGRTAARAAALGLLDQSIEPFLVVDALIVNAQNVEAGWQQSLNKTPPEVIINALPQ